MYEVCNHDTKDSIYYQLNAKIMQKYLGQQDMGYPTYEHQQPTVTTTQETAYHDFEAI